MLQAGWSIRLISHWKFHVVSGTECTFISNAGFDQAADVCWLHAAGRVGLDLAAIMVRVQDLAMAVVRVRGRGRVRATTQVIYILHLVSEFRYKAFNECW